MNNKRLSWLLSLLALFAAPAGRAVPAPLYENFGLVSDAPQIDATVFVNRGTFSFFTLAPFDTQNTRFFTNFNSMQASVGYQLDFVDDSGSRRPADTIINRGQIIGVDAGDLDPGFPIIFGELIGSYVELHATNIVSTGLLEVGPLGIVRVKGSKVTLARSGIRAATPEAGSGPSGRGELIGDDFYISAEGVTELFAGVGINGLLASDTGAQQGAGFLLNVGTLTVPDTASPLHQVVSPAAITNLISIPLSFPSFCNAWVLTNQISDTNFLVQVVFVKTNSFDTNLTTDVRFADNPFQQVPGGKTAIVEFGLSDIDAITGNFVTNTVYLLDTHATLTNAYYRTNIFDTNFVRPSNFEAVRGFLPEWLTAGPTNAVFTPDLLTAGFELQTVTNNYSSHGFFIGLPPKDLLNPESGFFFGRFLGLGTTESGLVFGGFGNPRLTDVTNQPGRIEIEADQLDIGLMRLKADGIVTLTSTDFNGRDPRRLDAPGFRLNLQKKEGTMIVSNVVPSTIRRLDGEFYAYSVIWTNFTSTTAPDGTTNALEFRFHALIVDRLVDSIRSVTSLETTLKAANVVWADNMFVTRSLLIDSVGFQNSGSINYGTGGSIGRANFPRMQYFTNAGTFFVDNVLDLGADTTNGWANVLNTGSFEANAIRAKSAVFENLGTLDADQDIITLVGTDVKFDGQPGNPLAPRGRVNARNDITIQANDFKSRNTDMSAGSVVTNAVTGAINYALGSLIFDVTTRLSDGGADASNQWSCVDGFALLQKPALGDLLGTAITVNGPRFGDVASLWTAEDRGATAAGYSNNVAVGRLVLDGELLTLFTFAGTAPGQALYVEFLELLNEATNVLESLNIPPGFTLYFADSNLPVEDLDGLFDGRLRWVPDFAGPQTAVTVTLAGGTQVRMNRALVSSRTIDSDGDGTANGLDATPFEPAALKVKMTVRRTSSQAEVSWLATPGRTYRVEYTTDLSGGAWTPLQTVTNDRPNPRDMAVQDAANLAGPSRFYRVVEAR